MVDTTVSWIGPIAPILLLGDHFGLINDTIKSTGFKIDGDAVQILNKPNLKNETLSRMKIKSKIYKSSFYS